MEKLALAMSGGVDSSAALLLLKDKYDVSGFTLKLHDRKVGDDTGLCVAIVDNIPRCLQEDKECCHFGRRDEHRIRGV